MYFDINAYLGTTTRNDISNGTNPYSYIGELDENEMPRGIGRAENEEGDLIEGTWDGGMVHGICK